MKQFCYLSQLFSSGYSQWTHSVLVCFIKICKMRSSVNSIWMNRSVTLALKILKWPASNMKPKRRRLLSETPARWEEIWMRHRWNCHLQTIKIVAVWISKKLTRTCTNWGLWWASLKSKVVYLFLFHGGCTN